MAETEKTFPRSGTVETKDTIRFYVKMCHTNRAARMCNVILLRNFSTSLAHARLPAGQLCIGGSGCSSATLFASANGEGWTELEETKIGS